MAAKSAADKARENEKKTVKEHAKASEKASKAAASTDSSHDHETKPETTGPIPDKFEDHPPTQASPEIGVEAVPGADPGVEGVGFAVIPGKHEDHPAVIADAHHTLGAASVPGEEPPGTPKSGWDVKADKHEDHPMTQDAPTLGEDAVPSNPRNEPADAEDEDEEDARSSSKRVKLRFTGFKDAPDAQRIPPAVTLTMPDKDGEAQEKAGRGVTSGQTLVVRRDEFREFSSKQAKWLESHKRYQFEKA